MRIRSRYDRSKLPVWWTQVLLGYGGREVIADAIIDSGSPITVVPREIADELFDTLGISLPFDGPKIHTAWGELKTSAIPIAVGIEGVGSRQMATIHVVEDRLKDFDFVVVGIGFLDLVEAVLRFGPTRPGALSDVGARESEPAAMTLFSPYRVLHW